MRVAVAADHAGFATMTSLREAIRSSGHEERHLRRLAKVVAIEKEGR